MRLAAGLILVAGLLAGPWPAAAGDLTLTLHDGRVTLICDNVTARQILAEWARLGQTKVVNGEKLTGPPLTLRLENVPERQALDIILRSASGFMAAERPTLVANASIYDRILVMPTSTPVAAGAAPPVAGRPAVGARQMPQPPAFSAPAPEPVDEQPVEDDPAMAAPMPYGDARPPETTFDYANPQEFLRRRQEMLQQQQMQQEQPSAPAVFPGTVLPYGPPGGVGGQQPTAPSPVPTAPPGVARPGQIVNPPQPPGGATFVNPYGLPYNVQPGSAAGTPMEPDRAKYANPYQPRPPQDPKDE